MLRLGKNVGRYLGETIDIQKVLGDTAQAAALHGWTQDHLPLELNDPQHPSELTAYRRLAPNARRRVYISAGIHGDEPAGPLAVRQLMAENQWPADISLWICPCLNPTGFPLNTRENFAALDLNRDYRHFQSAEVRAHIKWLDQQPAFDITLCLHEDWESHGFYLYEVNPGNLPSYAEAIIDRVSSVCPIDPSPIIEERPAQNGIIRPILTPAERPLWPEALYLIDHGKTRLSKTLEAPSDFPLCIRTAALVTAVRTVLELL